MPRMPSGPSLICGHDEAFHDLGGSAGKLRSRTLRAVKLRKLLPNLGLLLSPQIALQFTHVRQEHENGYANFRDGLFCSLTARAQGAISQRAMRFDGFNGPDCFNSVKPSLLEGFVILVSEAMSLTAGESSGGKC